MFENQRQKYGWKRIVPIYWLFPKSVILLQSNNTVIALTKIILKLEKKKEVSAQPSAEDTRSAEGGRCDVKTHL